MANTKPQVVIIDCTTGQEIARDANAQEIAQAKIDIENAKKHLAEIESKVAEKQALLDRLGITADEAKLLLG
jgi:hypothetical protein